MQFFLDHVFLILIPLSSHNVTNSTPFPATPRTPRPQIIPSIAGGCNWPRSQPQCSPATKVPVAVNPPPRGLDFLSHSGPSGCQPTTRRTSLSQPLTGPSGCQPTTMGTTVLRQTSGGRGRTASRYHCSPASLGYVRVVVFRQAPAAPAVTTAVYNYPLPAA